MAKRPIKMPEVEGPLLPILKFAERYNAYELWAAHPHELGLLLAPIHEHWKLEGDLPSWIGIDALKALLFYEYRASRQAWDSQESERIIRFVFSVLKRRLETPVQRSH